MKGKIINICFRNKLINKLFNSFIGFNFFKIKGDRNKLDFSFSLLKKNKITVIGVANIIQTNQYTKIYNSNIHINGSDNKIIIGKNVFIQNIDIKLWGNNNILIIGESTTFNTNCKIKVYEGKQIIIGSDCMFSYNVDMRTSDGHPIYENGIRINDAEDIKIGNHVWIGSDVGILKGSYIPNNSVVGTKTLYNKLFMQDNSLFVGVPVKLVRTNIKWERDF